MCDTDGKGFLRVAELHEGLRLIALAQEGKPLDAASNAVGWPLPKLEGLAALAPAQSSASSNTNLDSRSESLSPEELQRHARLFESAGPKQGLLDGASCRVVFTRSNLSNEILGKIWSLVNPSKSPGLLEWQFIAAMHIIGKLADGSFKSVPTALPSYLQASSIPSSNAAASNPTLAAAKASSLSILSSNNPDTKLASAEILNNPVSPLVLAPAPASGSSPIHSAILPLISKDERLKADNYFATLDKKKLGLLYGPDVADFFKASNLPSSTLSSIWYDYAALIMYHLYLISCL